MLIINEQNKCWNGMRENVEGWKEYDWMKLEECVKQNVCTYKNFVF